MNRVLVITGMHRSGTSLIGNWLTKAGLDLGENLIGATQSNIYGHFEDIEIVEFHEELLRFNGTNLYQGIGDPLKFSASHIENALRIIEYRNKNEVWGWKQPRAALFLDLWIKLLPENSFYLCPFRHYEEVLNSLYKREYNKIDLKNSPKVASKKKEEFKSNKREILNSYLSMWIRHNEEILRLRNMVKMDSVLYVSVDSIIKLNKQILGFMIEIWGFTNLRMVDLHSVYNSSQLSRQTEPIELDSELQRKADTVLFNLEEEEMNVIKKLA